MPVIDRRQLLHSVPLVLASPALGGNADRFAPLRRTIADIERNASGRIGVALVDTGSGARFAHRADTRFALCSTFKLLLAARLLDGAGKGLWQMDDRLPIRAADMLANAPFSQTRIGGSASLMEMAEAMCVLSDNPAANLALARVGGPAALTAWLREAGDTVTRLDRFEPEMNNEVPGDVRDTTTPAAMLATCQQLVAGPLLSGPARAQLRAWMAASRTADTMIRAGLPAGWREANKTGAGKDHARNIVSIITPPGRPPIWLAAYLFAAPSTLAARDSHFPGLGRAIVESLG